MPHPARFWTLIAADPRHGQILTLAGLLTYGLGWLSFDIGLPQVAVTLVSALAVQRLGDAWTGAPWRSGAKSALISALSLCLLLRTDALWIAAVGSAIAVGSKFVIRVRGKHVFNPTNGALVALLLTTDLAWVSPGPVGHRRGLRLHDGVRRDAGGQPRRPQRRHAGLHRAPGRRCWSAARCRSASR